MSKVTGFKFKIKNDEIIPIAGKPVLTHRIDLIAQKIKDEKYDECWQMFFNFKLDDCETKTSLKQMQKELEMYNDLLLLEESLAA